MVILFFYPEVMPSHQGNFGIVVAEALACGKPVLISKVNIWRDIDKTELALLRMMIFRVR